MSRYRKIDPRIWNDEKFRTLSDDGKLGFLFLLTHPSMTALGAMRATAPGLAAELGWPARRWSIAVAPAISSGMVEANVAAAYIGLPKFLRYNEPEGPNSITKAWLLALDFIPECDERRALIARCRAYLDGKSDDFRRAIGKAIWDAFPMPSGMAYPMPSGMASPDPSPIHEQEPEQEPEQEQEKREAGAAGPPAPGGAAPAPRVRQRRAGRAVKIPLPDDFGVSDATRHMATEEGLPNPDEEVKKFRDWARAKAERSADWEARFRNWLRRAAEYRKTAGGPGVSGGSGQPSGSYSSPEIKRRLSEKASKLWGIPMPGPAAAGDAGAPGGGDE